MQTNNFDQRLRALPTFLGFVIKTNHAIFYPTSSYLQSLWRFIFLALMFSMLYLIHSLFTGFTLSFSIAVYTAFVSGLIFSFFCYLAQYYKKILFILIALVIFVKLNGSVAYADTLEAVQSSVIIKTPEQSNLYWDLTIWLGIVIGSCTLSLLMSEEQMLTFLICAVPLTAILGLTETVDDLVVSSIATEELPLTVHQLPDQLDKGYNYFLKNQVNAFLNEINNQININTTSCIILVCYTILVFVFSFFFFRNNSNFLTKKLGLQAFLVKTVIVTPYLLFQNLKTYIYMMFYKYPHTLFVVLWFSSFFSTVLIGLGLRNLSVFYESYNVFTPKDYTSFIITNQISQGEASDLMLLKNQKSFLQKYWVHLYILMLLGIFFLNGDGRSNVAPAAAAAIVSVPAASAVMLSAPAA